jgi:hypothetical protein
MIELQTNQLDLGEVKLQTQRFFTIPIKNTTDKNLVVTAKPSCASCTFLQSAPEFLPALGEGFYTFIYRPDTLGDMIRSIHFQVDNKVEQSLNFKAKVI